MPTPHSRRTSFGSAALRRYLTGSALGLLLGACQADRAAGPLHDPAGASTRLDQLDETGLALGRRGRLLEAQLVRTIPQAAVAQLVAQTGSGAAYRARHAVDHWSVTYTTLGIRGETVTASGAIFLPVDAEDPLQIVSFSHGTATVKSAVPGNPATSHPLGVLNASHGAVAVLADYIGNGVDAARFHPYLHAASEASASIDAVRAALSLAGEQEIRLDGRLFLFGYSQGGHAVMAMLRELESRAPHGLMPVTAAAPMAGPYDIAGTAAIFLGDAAPNVPRSIALIRALAAYEETYGMAGGLDELFVAPYDEVARRLIYEGMPAAQAQMMVPPVPRDALTETAVAAILDPGSDLSRVLRQNGTIDWAPRTPVRMYYGSADALVPPQNALTAEARMRQLGARDVAAVNVGSLTHTTANWPSFIAARQWFDTFQAPGSGEECFRIVGNRVLAAPACFSAIE